MSRKSGAAYYDEDDFDDVYEEEGYGDEYDEPVAGPAVVKVGTCCSTCCTRTPPRGTPACLRAAISHARTTHIR